MKKIVFIFLFFSMYLHALNITIDETAIAEKKEKYKEDIEKVQGLALNKEEFPLTPEEYEKKILLIYYIITYLNHHGYTDTLASPIAFLSCKFVNESKKNFKVYKEILKDITIQYFNNFQPSIIESALLYYVNEAEKYEDQENFKRCFTYNNSLIKVLNEISQINSECCPRTAEIKKHWWFLCVFRILSENKLWDPKGMPRSSLIDDNSYKVVRHALRFLHKFLSTNNEFVLSDKDHIVSLCVIARDEVELFKKIVSVFNTIDPHNKRDLIILMITLLKQIDNNEGLVSRLETLKEELRKYQKEFPTYSKYFDKVGREARNKQACSYELNPEENGKDIIVWKYYVRAFFDSSIATRVHHVRNYLLPVLRVLLTNLTIDDLIPSFINFYEKNKALKGWKDFFLKVLNDLKEEEYYSLIKQLFNHYKTQLQNHPDKLVNFILFVEEREIKDAFIQDSIIKPLSDLKSKHPLEVRKVVTQIINALIQKQERMASLSVSLCSRIETLFGVDADIPEKYTWIKMCFDKLPLKDKLWQDNYMLYLLPLYIVQVSEYTIHAEIRKRLYQYCKGENIDVISLIDKMHDQRVRGNDFEKIGCTPLDRVMLLFYRTDNTKMMSLIKDYARAIKEKEKESGKLIEKLESLKLLFSMEKIDKQLEPIYTEINTFIDNQLHELRSPVVDEPLKSSESSVVAEPVVDKPFPEPSESQIPIGEKVLHESKPSNVDESLNKPSVSSIIAEPSFTVNEPVVDESLNKPEPSMTTEPSESQIPIGGQEMVIYNKPRPSKFEKLKSFLERAQRVLGLSYEKINKIRLIGGLGVLATLIAIYYRKNIYHLLSRAKQREIDRLDWALKAFRNNIYKPMFLLINRLRKIGHI